MTVARSSSLTSSSINGNGSCRSKKDLPKRAVSFIESVKFQAPQLRKNQEPTKLHDDDDGGDRDHLQATNKRRRYMRRGSKCPSMFIGMANFKSILQDAAAAADNDDFDADKTKMMLYHHHHQHQQQKHQQARRLSLMSALKASLESNCSVVAASSSKTTTPLQQLRKMPPQERRMSALELLTSVVAENDSDDDDMMMIMGI